LLANAYQHTSLRVRRNEPYGPQDGVTHTLLEHAVSNGLHNVMIEIRNDLIATPEAQDGVAEMLSRLISSGLRDLSIAGAGGDT